MQTQTTPDTDALIERHLPLVRQVVVQAAAHFPRHVDREELATAGALGLVEAARRYDADRGVPFDRFAAHRIRGAIFDAARTDDWVPRSVRKTARHLDAMEDELAGNLGRRPSSTERATALGISAEELHRMEDKVFRSMLLGLNAPDRGDDGAPLAERIVDPNSLEPSEEFEQSELHRRLRDAVSLLPRRHRVVVIGYFLEGRSSLELAGFLGVSESRISQIRSDALTRLRASIGDDLGLTPPDPDTAPDPVEDLAGDLHGDLDAAPA